MLARVNTAAYGWAMTKRALSPEDWIAAGLRALARGGPAALRAEAIARDIGATKGSFYWHFKDLPAYKSAILDLWQRRCTEDIIAIAKTEPDASTRLASLIAQATADPTDPVTDHAAEQAIRAWSRHDPLAAVAVARVDQQRLAFLGDQLAAMGGKADRNARLLYAAHLGLELLLPKAVDTRAADLHQLLGLLTR